MHRNALKSGLQSEAAPTYFFSKVGCEGSAYFCTSGVYDQKRRQKNVQGEGQRKKIPKIDRKIAILSLFRGREGGIGKK